MLFITTLKKMKLMICMIYSNHKYYLFNIKKQKCLLRRRICQINDNG